MQNKKTGSAAPTAAVLSAGILWGGINVFVRSLSDGGLSPLQISMVRMVTSIISVLLFLLLTRHRCMRVRFRDLWMFVGTGIVSIVCFNVCYFRTLVKSQASVAVVLLYTSPVFVMLLSALLYRERITRRGVLALILTVGGCVFVAGLGADTVIPPSVLLTGLASGLFYALYTIFGRTALKHYDSITVTTYTFLFSAAGAIPLGQPVSVIRIFSERPVLILFAFGIGIVSTVMPYFLYTWGLDRMPSGKAAILVAVEPLVGAVIGMTVYGESRGPGKLLGIALILASIIILGMEKPEPSASDKQNKTEESSK